MSSRTSQTNAKASKAERFVERVTSSQVDKRESNRLDDVEATNKKLLGELESLQRSLQEARKIQAAQSSQLEQKTDDIKDLRQLLEAERAAMAQERERMVADKKLTRSATIVDLARGSLHPSRVRAKTTSFSEAPDEEVSDADTEEMEEEMDELEELVAHPEVEEPGDSTEAAAGTNGNQTGEKKPGEDHFVDQSPSSLPSAAKGRWQRLATLKRRTEKLNIQLAAIIVTKGAVASRVKALETKMNEPPVVAGDSVEKTGSRGKKKVAVEPAKPAPNKATEEGKLQILEDILHQNVEAKMETDIKLQEMEVKMYRMDALLADANAGRDAAVKESQDLEKRMKSLQGDLSSAAHSLSGVVTGQDHALHEKAALEAKVQELQDELAEANGAGGDSSSPVTGMKSEVVLAERIKRLEKDLEDAKREQAEKDAQVHSIRSHSENLQESLAQTKEQLVTMQDKRDADMWQQKLKADVRIQDLETKLKKVEKSMSSTLEENRELSARCNAMQHDLDHVAESRALRAARPSLVPSHVASSLSSHSVAIWSPDQQLYDDIDNSKHELLAHISSLQQQLDLVQKSEQELREMSQTSWWSKFSMNFCTTSRPQLAHQGTDVSFAGTTGQRRSGRSTSDPPRKKPGADLLCVEGAKSQEDLKREVGYKAVDDYVKSGTVIGLGTGSTAYYAVERVGQKLKSGELQDIVAIPTSERTKEQAQFLGIPLGTLDTHPDVDVAIDGADNVDPKLNLTKGGGGALFREKRVEISARQFVVVVDESKLCNGLGPGFPVPVEIVPFCHAHTIRKIAALPALAGCDPHLRMGDVSNNKVDGAQIAVTDNGNYVVDLMFWEPIRDPAAAARELIGTVGVVEHGLFIGMTTVCLIAQKDGSIVKMP